jgi:hypothetical protein
MRVLHNVRKLLDPLLSPLSAIAYTFAFWRLTADIGWSAPFIVATGFFSHWIVWLSIGVALSLRRFDENSAIDERPGTDRPQLVAVNPRKKRRQAATKVGYASALSMVQPKRGLNHNEQPDEQPADRERKIPA